MDDLTFLYDLEYLLVQHALYLDVPVQTLPLDVLHTLTAFPLCRAQRFLEIMQEALSLLHAATTLLLSVVYLTSQALPMAMLGLTHDCFPHRFELQLNKLYMTPFSI